MGVPDPSALKPLQGQVTQSSSASWVEIVRKANSGADASMPSTVRLRPGNTEGQPNQAVTKISIAYQWKPSRCGKCSKVGHTESQCKPPKEYRPTGRIFKNPSSRGRRKLGSHPAETAGQVAPRPVKSNAVIIYKDPIESSMAIDEAGSGNEKAPNIEPSTGIQLHRDSCPGVSCSNSFAGLHLADEVSPLQAANPPYEIPRPTGRIQAKDLPSSPLGRDKIKGPLPSPMKNFSGLCNLPYIFQNSSDSQNSSDML
ncbi:hypothetical protein Nepgr_003880 [Nepenthes gracilis]|uniref:Uncharacterized protein n=1 Tax=Nepenthes gracilis TaxID=150966 RepID=A0AAD3XEL1_NEPGR|nr:hypothetical protein Nepgr_003880 [Nepenthes gracilis]